MKHKKSLKKVVHEFKTKTYQKPRLICYGDVRDVTLGGSPGAGDSGSPTTRRRR